MGSRTLRRVRIMKEIPATITSKGQVTIPAEVRRHLGLKERDKIAFVIEDEGNVRLKVPEFPTIQSLRGIAGTLPKPAAWKEVLQTAREDALIEKFADRDD
jgi:antitoxin PrlF